MITHGGTARDNPDYWRNHNRETCEDCKRLIAAREVRHSIDALIRALEALKELL